MEALDIHVRGDVLDTIEAVRDFIRYDNKLYAAENLTENWQYVCKWSCWWDGINWFQQIIPIK